MHISDNNIKNNRIDKQKTGKRMPVWLLIMIDISLALICLGIFSVYHLVIPRHLSSSAIVVTTEEDGDDMVFDLPNDGGEDDSSEANENSEIDENSEISENLDIIENSDVNENLDANENSEVNETGNDKEQIDEQNMGSAVGNVTKTDPSIQITNYGNSDTLDIQGDATELEYISTAEKKRIEVNSYSSDNIQFTTNKVEIGSGAEKITYYISDIYVTNVKYLKTAFAKGEYGKNLKEPTLDMAINNSALLAINGDYYGNSEVGVVIRNGILYRTEVYDADISVLFTDGTLNTYSPQEFNIDQVLEEGAWQAWIFGPKLLDKEGNVLSTFNSTYYLSKEHPRTAIGYIEPGHYIFVVADGRNLGYSRGVTLSELGQIMAEAGCKSAYNLDGGKSSAMAYGDSYVNQPYEGSRPISDIIYLGE